MPDEEKGFSVKDRRLFSGEESEKTSKEDIPEGSPSAGETTGASRPEAAARTGAEDLEDMLLPAVNFPTFILSLNASALLHLGAIEDPETGRPSKNLPMAKQTIDILSMLAEKTRGNLTQDEENMLKNILYDLRIAYVREKS
ncbi:MAG: DUF1844 domain-containing protein [Desulfobacterales bacterium]